MKEIMLGLGGSTCRRLSPNEQSQQGLTSVGGVELLICQLTLSVEMCRDPNANSQWELTMQS